MNLIPAPSNWWLSYTYPDLDLDDEPLVLVNLPIAAFGVSPVDGEIVPWAINDQAVPPRLEPFGGAYKFPFVMVQSVGPRVVSYE